MAAKTTQNMSAARLGRLNKVLDRQRNFGDFGMQTFRQVITPENFSGVVAYTTPVISYNRRKFNRMNAAEQRAYEAKLKETKTAYGIVYRCDPNTHMIVPKIVYEWAKEIFGGADNAT